jgi:hypothetical protein
LSFTVESSAAKVHDTHTLCRAYISIALLDNNFDVKWVMAQVGHADSKMALDVYAQLEQRVDRSHGTSFDRLIGLAGSPRHQMKRHTLQGTRLFEIAPLVNIRFRQVRVRRGRVRHSSWGARMGGIPRR